MAFPSNVKPVVGQQVTINYHSQTDTEQPGFSRDAIAEFEVVANRFDVTQGRSQGMVVNAVTKSGTNAFAGTIGGYFRDDRFNSKDFITDTVLPYSNQQVSTTFGGPIRRESGASLPRRKRKNELDCPTTDKRFCRPIERKLHELMPWIEAFGQAFPERAWRPQVFATPHKLRATAALLRWDRQGGPQARPIRRDC